MNGKQIVKTGQEQAVASWINYLNQVRLDNLIQFLNQQNINLSEALADIDKTFEDIQHLIVTNRGGVKGMHGFIAEAAEVGLGNAKANVLGHPDIYKWIDDNGVVDLCRCGTDIQQKFYQNGLSLGAVTVHLAKYPDFIVNGGKYQIPKDQYDKIKYLLSVSKEEANKMPTSDGTFSLKQWKLVHEFFESGNVSVNDIEPSLLEYGDVQVGQIEETLKQETSKIKETDAKLREAAKEKSMPSLKEGTQVTVLSAAIEGGTTFIFSIAKKKNEGRKLSEFTADDWKDIVSQTGGGTIKGGIRGASIYALTNYTATPAALASSFVTASFNIAEQAHLFRKGKLNEVQFIENAEIVCLDAAVSGASSLIGQAILPIPVIGAVVGNTVGTMMYKIAKESLCEREQEIIKKYLSDLQEKRQQMDQNYATLVEELSREFVKYMKILEQLYSVDIEVAFNASVEMAEHVGVPRSEILDTKEKVYAFFLD